MLRMRIVVVKLFLLMELSSGYKFCMLKCLFNKGLYCYLATTYKAWLLLTRMVIIIM